MEDAVAKMIDRLRAVTRQGLLLILVSAITEIIIVGGKRYDDENSGSHLRRLNDAIHLLSSHLRDLCDPGEEFTRKRAGVIQAVLTLFTPPPSLDFSGTRVRKQCGPCKIAGSIDQPKPECC